MALIDIPRAEQPLSFIVEDGERLPAGINIENELELAMADKGGTLQYWKLGSEVGTCSGFDRNYFQAKFDATVSILKDRCVVDEYDIEKTQQFIDEIFGVYEGARTPQRYGGSFAFVAAHRVQRRSPEQSEFAACDYRRETVGCLPILKYVDESTAQRVMVGMPPFTLDYYGADNNGGGGVMIFSPLSLDLLPDSGVNGIEVGMAVAQETSWFAKERMGVKLMSLAALLPKHTGYGELFKYPGIETTTGHGGTTWLIGETVDRAIREGRVDPKLASKIGVLGVGGIGYAVADLLLERDRDLQLAINDHNRVRQAEVAQSLSEKYGAKRVLPINNIADLLKFGGVTVSAITKPVDLVASGLKPGDLEGRVYADDSQPAAIASEQVMDLGGLHVGVIGEDGTDFGAVSGSRFNYGGLGPLRLGNELGTRGDAYGCCIEGAALFYGEGMIDRITQPVDGDRTRIVGKYCKDMGFTASALQTIHNGKARLV